MIRLIAAVAAGWLLSVGCQSEIEASGAGGAGEVREPPAEIAVTLATAEGGGLAALEEAMCRGGEPLREALHQSVWALLFASSPDRLWGFPFEKEYANQPQPAAGLAEVLASDMAYAYRASLETHDALLEVWADVCPNTDYRYPGMSDKREDIAKVRAMVELRDLL